MRLIPLFAISCVALAACSSATVGTTAPQTFTNQTYGFSFLYPSTYEARVYTPEHVTVGTGSGEGIDGRAEVEVLRGEVTADDLDYDRFVESALRATCAADGPGISLSCTGVRSRDPLTSPSGQTFEEIYLETEERRFAGEGDEEDEVLAGTKGPFYVANIGANVEDDGFAILVIRPPTNVAQSDVDQVLLRSIRDSLVTFTVPRSRSSSMR